ncbi:MAG: OPT/YSL family transporter [Candidatus Hodarchaeota archaeon]
MRLKNESSNASSQDLSNQVVTNTLNPNQDISKSVVFIGVIVGLVMNWLALYLNIILGLLSIGISGFVVLLVTKLILQKRATQSNLALVSVAYGATSAAEASVGLLFLIWLCNNASSFGLTFNAPRWLLPSSEIIATRTILTLEWVVPLITHYFLMFIPGITGLILGIYLAPKFLFNDEEYPFPGTIQRTKTVEVLVTNQRSKVLLFTRFLLVGFIIAAITLFLPVLDFSNTSNGMILGLMLGTVGVTMFAVGLVINNPKITIPAGISSILMYTIISPLLIDINDFKSQVTSGNFQFNFFGIYSYLLQTTYLSFLIGFILSAAIITPFIWSILKRTFEKIKKNSKEKNRDTSTSSKNEKKSIEGFISSQDENNYDIDQDSSPKTKLTTNLAKLIGKRELLLFSMYLIALILSALFVFNLKILSDDTPFLIIIMLLIWILFLGSLIQGYITVTTIAKSSVATTPPFIFDMIPLFLVGARNITPYVATPKGEVGETINIVSTLKFAQQMKVSQRHTLIAFLAGYFTAMIVTPFFTLFLWQALGIGTVNFPAPGFPIMLAMIGPFAAGAIDVFLNIGEVLFGAISALFFPSVGISLAIGMFFPPHMALPLTLGGILALLLQRKYGKSWMEDKGRTAATALSVGATFTVPILILLSIL